MPLLSITEDFLIRSLGPLKNAVARLRYLGQLRRGAVYEHWGMEQKYGIERTNSALSEIHSRLWLEVLRTPIQQLNEEVQEEERVLNPGQDHSILSLSSPALIPANTRGGSIRHMKLIATTLSMLKATGLSKRQVA